MIKENVFLVNGNDHRKDVAFLRGGVELLAEGHDVDPLLTKRRTYWWSRVRLTGGDLQLDLTNDFLWHG